VRRAAPWKAAQPRSFIPARQCRERRIVTIPSTEIEDDDTAFGVILFAWLGGRPLRLLRKLELGLLELVTPTFLLFPPPDLIDDERRKHAGLAFRASTARRN
jgi:hypothetical protein